jgi:hypothetical protein
LKQLIQPNLQNNLLIFPKLKQLIIELKERYQVKGVLVEP